MSQSSLGDINDASNVDNFSHTTECILCQRPFSADNDGGELEASNMCMDCKFLLLEDFETPTRNIYQRRRGLRRRRRRRGTTSESIRNLFTQQFPQRIDLARTNQPLLVEPDSQPLNTTPSGSRRWRRVLSDTVSDGMSSYSAYGEDSDSSVDSYSIMEIDGFGNLDGDSEFETDTDIDPMHAGLYHSNSDDGEGEESEEDSEWGEGNVEENALGTRLQRSTSSYGRRPVINWRRTIRVTPAAISFVKNLPRLVIDRDREDIDDLACAICKDSLHAGTVVNQLPCSHIYHPSCITPWLSDRNSCPLCRFQLPTNDKNYENRKQTSTIFHRVVAGPLVSVVGIVLVLWLGKSISGRKLSIPFPIRHDQRQDSSTIGRRRWWSLV